MSDAYGSLGLLHHDRGELDQAVVAMYGKSLALDTELGNKNGMAIGYHNLGQVHQERGELDQARKLWEKSADIFDAMSSPNADRVRSLIDALSAN